MLNTINIVPIHNVASIEDWNRGNRNFYCHFINYDYMHINNDTLQWMEIDKIVGNGDVCPLLCILGPSYNKRITIGTLYLVTMTLNLC